ncbi:MAG: hypothetical protein HXX13_17955 [Bacteroidetes bacterium]|nr:hypothetical protein [Bacteroidota bacterium]
MIFNRNLLLTILLWSMGCIVFAQVHTTYLWHLEQPNYWPATSTWITYQYQKAWESQYLKWNNGNFYSDGLQHPLNNLQEIFGNDDRKAVYQYRAKDAVQSLLGLPEAGAQVSYSGCLMENVKSLADAGQWGYSQGWQNNFITARNWTTSAGKPRMDMVGFSMDHALSPLVSDKVLRRQIQAHRYLYNQNFGTSPNYSKGYWPAECAFSERIIKALVEEGFEWSIIANSHLARTLSDYPLNYGTSGCNIDPPNPADKVTATGNHWWSGQIDGRGGTFAAPYCYQAHKAKYVDPSTGTEYKITVVPMDDLLSYQNGYSLMGTGDIDSHIAPYNDNSHPSLVLLAHDGDNAWGGGYDYYSSSVPGFANEAASKGYVPTTIQQFLTQHPVPETDVVHVEDGSWFNAANDWGHPQFINWLWPMYTSGYQFNPNGWTEDARNWAVLVAAENRVQMSEDLQGTLNIANIVNPGAASNAAEEAWHYLLPAYNSGYMYYGTSLDMEVKQSLACNIACSYANQVINAHPSTDQTAPTVFIPQRYPYNPGGTGFGPTYAYQQHQNSTDFSVWTFAYDVSGVQTAVLKYRLDNDGVNASDNNDNETYAGGSSVQAWQSLSMNMRVFPTGNVTNNPDINFFILPDYIANEYYAQISGLTEKLVDYYVEVTDTKGNIAKTPIQHVYVGTSGSNQTAGVSWSPENPAKNDVITITETNVTVGAKLHWGVNAVGSSWQSPNAAYWPQNSTLFNGTGPALESVMSGPDNLGTISIQIGPFNNTAQAVSGVDFVMHYTNNTWNNNSGQNFHIPISNVADTVLQASPASQSVASAGGSVSFIVTSNTSWTASSDQSWCSTISTGSGNGSILVNVAANIQMSPRTAHILVSGPGASTVTLTINQDASLVPHTFGFILANDQQTSDRTLEFDLLLEDMDAADVFELGSAQAAITLNPAILNGGTVTASIVPDSSGLNVSQAPAFISFVSAGNCIRLVTKAPPGAGNGTVLSVNSAAPTRLCRVRLTNTVAFGQAQPNLAFTFATRPYPTRISQYINQVNTALLTDVANCYSNCDNNVLNASQLLSVSPQLQTISEAEGSASYTVSSSTSWTAHADQAWCSVTSSGFGNAILLASCSANLGSVSRTATITVSAAGLPDVILTLVQNGSTLRPLAVHFFLEGLYAGYAQMRPARDASGNHWTADVADKVNLELHDPANFSHILYTIEAAELKTDGSISVSLPSAFSGTYYLVVRHRNSILTASALPLVCSGSSLNYSFDNASKAFGGNLKQLPDGNWAIYCGDVNQDGVINDSDMALVDADAVQFNTGYLATDLDGDGIIDAADQIILDNNATRSVIAVLPQ